MSNLKRENNQYKSWLKKKEVIGNIKGNVSIQFILQLLISEGRKAKEFFWLI